jgi:hypothetical protein
MCKKFKQYQSKMYDDMSDGIPDGSAKSGVGFQNLQTKK